MPMAVYEEPRQYLLRVEFPGLAREQVGVRVEEGMLQIRGGQRPPSTFKLPGDVDPRSVVADFRDGVLQVRLPRLSLKRSWWPC
ncbi:MAG: Hsp20/alpha crystallin family [Verrucomicrobiaceae bacterium]|nr:Hsp20/alpha crystallin family [Verrucomicrobiaceae bacterium]